jgi:hypothetical protein
MPSPCLPLLATVGLLSFLQSHIQTPRPPDHSSFALNACEREKLQAEENKRQRDQQALVEQEKYRQKGSGPAGRNAAAVTADYALNFKLRHYGPRLHWGGKPVEIIGRRLDLTKTQGTIAVAVALFTALAAFGTLVQAGVAYHDWACKTGRPAIVLPPVETALGAGL